MLYTCIKFQLLYPKEKILKVVTCLGYWPWKGQSDIKERAWFLKWENPDFTNYYICGLQWIYKFSNFEFPHLWNMSMYFLRVLMGINKENYIKYLAQCLKYLKKLVSLPWTYGYVKKTNSHFWIHINIWFQEKL